MDLYADGEQRGLVEPAQQAGRGLPDERLLDGVREGPAAEAGVRLELCQRVPAPFRDRICVVTVDSIRFKLAYLRVYIHIKGAAEPEARSKSTLTV